MEHIRLFNNQDTYKNKTIESKANYALVAYSNSIHSVTKLKQLEITTGHLDSNSIFNLDTENKLINKYITVHKNKMKIIY